MADGTKIEWADATVNAINGCSLASPGCTNCYAMRLAGTRLRNHPSREGLTQPSKAGPVWNGTVKLSESALYQPLKWQRSRVIFWNAHGDTFHDAVPDEWIDRMFAVMALTPQHKHLVLTKRSARMREYVTRFSEGGHHVDSAIWEMCCPLPGGGWSTSADTTPWSQRARDTVKTMLGSPARPWVLPNVWLGVSAEDQARADERIPDLLATSAAGRFLSCEPLLGPIDLTNIRGEPALTPECWGDCNCDSFAGFDPGCRRHGGDGTLTRKIDGLIVGGESGPGSRPMHPEWARDIRDACDEAGVDFHFKQWGDWAPGENALKAQTRTERCASWWDDHWDYSSLTVRQGEELHRDDEPDLFRFGKKGASRHLDGELRDDLTWRRAS